MSEPSWLDRARDHWKHRGGSRPQFAHPTEPGEESVWDYPRPPRLEADAREVRVVVDDIEIAKTRRAMRLLETASPPTFYLPPDDVNTQLLVAAAGASMCEWKGRARYWSVRTQSVTVERVGWCYPDAYEPYQAIKDWYCFYPSKLECFVEGERVRAQPGDFYGGWVTDEVIGPFKGDPGTGGW